ncbi:MAG: iron-sulfur cluster carrier protein ApbC [Deltaproteobacteria bacterium]|nr:iron-sulfur cluster carrier protein ApbC [Deltaproteobacteria bacterium]MCL5276639.1 iron-sulfur cluster carrier protein ApbC [Deltaproteobacteria bacterium]
MSNIELERQVLNALSKVEDPELKRDVVSLGMIRDLKIENGTVSFRFVLTTPACPLADSLSHAVREAVESIDWVKSADIKLDSAVLKAKSPGPNKPVPIEGVKNIIAVGSGKGGVGKSTVSVNLAVALAQTGAKVGLIDADIYGPDVPMLLGITREQRHAIAEKERLEPVEAHGIKAVSIGLILPDDTPVIWRGPLISQMIDQFLTQIKWGEIDYMIVDLPPGTGDIQLTLVQKAPINGALIVSTPQDVSLLDATKALNMFMKVDVPVLGMIENMSYFICPHCGKQTNIFGTGGVEEAANRLSIDFMGRIPLEPRVREGGDSGRPIVAEEQSSMTAMEFKNIAARVASRLSVQNMATRDR